MDLQKALSSGGLNGGLSGSVPAGIQYGQGMSVQAPSITTPGLTPRSTPGLTWRSVGGPVAQAQDGNVQGMSTSAPSVSGGNWWNSLVSGASAAAQQGPVYNTQQSSFLSGMPTALQNIQTSGNDAFSNYKSQLQDTAQGIFSGLRTGQQNIDLSRQNNELNRMNGVQDLLGYIRSGIKQGASRLASMNATDSSAAPELTKAYQQIGAQKARGINNQAAQQANTIDIQQNNLNQGIQDQQASFARTRDNIISQIGQNIRNSLEALNQQAVGLSLPDRISVEQEKQKVINSGMGQLQEVDQWLKSQIAGIKPQTADQVALAARNLQTIGTTGQNPFNVDPFGAQQISGPSVDQLPLYSLRKKTN